MKPVAAALSFALILCGLSADRSWWDQHFLPIFAFPRPAVIAAEQALRVSLVLIGLFLAFRLRRPLPQMTVGGALRVVLAIGLALIAGEGILRLHPPRPHDADPMELEPRRQPDPKLGWVFVPGRSAVALEAGRQVSYSFDPAGYRVAAPADTVDFDRPTLVFIGESIMVGYGLDWEETIPARVGASLSMQSANLAVSDYSTDQSYLRLAAELPRFRKPVAVIALFMPSLFDRNLLENRPRLDGLKAGPQWRLAALLHWLIPYRSKAAIDEGISRTRASLRGIAEIARQRGAIPVILVPQFGPETPVEAMLRRRILEAENLPYIRVALEPDQHLPGDPHPDSQAAAKIAAGLAVFGNPSILLP